MQAPTYKVANYSHKALDYYVNVEYLNLFLFHSKIQFIYYSVYYWIG